MPKAATAETTGSTKTGMLHHTHLAFRVGKIFLFSNSLLKIRLEQKEVNHHYQKMTFKSNLNQLPFLLDWTLFWYLHKLHLSLIRSMSLPTRALENYSWEKVYYRKKTVGLPALKTEVLSFKLNSINKVSLNLPA